MRLLAMGMVLIVISASSVVMAQSGICPSVQSFTLDKQQLNTPTGWTVTNAKRAHAKPRFSHAEWLQTIKRGWQGRVTCFYQIPDTQGFIVVQSQQFKEVPDNGRAWVPFPKDNLAMHFMCYGALQQCY